MDFKYIDTLQEENILDYYDDILQENSQISVINTLHFYCNIYGGTTVIQPPQPGPCYIKPFAKDYVGLCTSTNGAFCDFVAYHCGGLPGYVAVLNCR